MSDELVYLLLICGLLIVPRALQRFRVPAPLTCFAIGIAVMLAIRPKVPDNAAVELLATLGICSLFLFAGLEVNLRQLRGSARLLLLHLAVRVATLSLVSWFAWRVMELDWQPAILLALALLTPSTGFIVDSLDRFRVTEDERFWIASKAISGELLSLAVMFFALKGSSLPLLGESLGVLAALVVAVPLLYLLLARWVAPHAPGSEFSLLIVVGLAAAYVTEKLGVEYLVGAFIAGLAARQLRPRLPGLASDTNLHAVKLFASFFIPFFFFSNGARLTTDVLSWEAAAIGTVITAVVLPMRVGVLWLQRKLLFGDGFRSCLRVSVALMPTFIFTLVLAGLMRKHYGIPDILYGGLLFYAVVNTLLPSLILRMAFDPLTAVAKDTATPASAAAAEPAR